MLTGSHLASKVVIYLVTEVNNKTSMAHLHIMGIGAHCNKPRNGSTRPLQADTYTITNTGKHIDKQHETQSITIGENTGETDMKLGRQANEH